MKEKPIIFSTPMVRAILDGRKTMTRRVIKIPPPFSVDDDNDVSIVTGVIKNDKYEKGNLLWVRETWRDGCKWDEKPFQYRADYIDDGVFPEKWKSSRFMPREAARIFLEVTDVRVERLQKITEEDAEREGVNQQCCLGPNGVIEFKRSFKNGFHILWDTLNAKRGYGWDFNPWVYVISFRRLGNELQK